MIEDLTEESEKCGTIVDVRVPRPEPGTDAAAAVARGGCYGKVYVLMEDESSAARLRDVVHGRAYDGRTLAAGYVQPGHFYQLPMVVGTSVG